MSTGTARSEKPTPRLIEVEKAARLIDVNPTILQDAVKDGELEAYRHGRQTLVRRDALLEFAERVDV